MRTVPRGPLGGRRRRTDLQLRVHVLRAVRERGRTLSELRRRARAPTATDAVAASVVASAGPAERGRRPSHSPELVANRKRPGFQSAPRSASVGASPTTQRESYGEDEEDVSGRDRGEARR